MRKPILIVDDAPDIRRTLKMVFESEGFETVEVANGREALDALARGVDPGLIILDWMMPVLSGEEFVEQLDSVKLPFEPPIYVLSAAERQPERIDPRIVGWLKKPVGIEEMLQVARRHLR